MTSSPISLTAEDCHLPIAAFCQKVQKSFVTTPAEHATGAMLKFAKHGRCLSLTAAIDRCRVLRLLSRGQLDPWQPGGDEVYHLFRQAANWPELLPPGRSFSIQARVANCTRVPNSMLVQIRGKDAICDSIRDARLAFHRALLCHACEMGHGQVLRDFKSAADKFIVNSARDALSCRWCLSLCLACLWLNCLCFDTCITAFRISVSLYLSLAACTGFLNLLMLRHNMCCTSHAARLQLVLQVHTHDVCHAQHLMAC